MKNNSLENLILIICMLFFSSPSFAMFCPENLKEIQVGDTIDHVLALCGKPDTQGTYADTVPYTDEEISAEPESASAQNIVESDEEEQKSVVVTKFIYNRPHPAILIFEDGKLTSKYGSNSGAIFMQNNHINSRRLG